LIIDILLVKDNIIYCIIDFIYYFYCMIEHYYYTELRTCVQYDSHLQRLPELTGGTTRVLAL